jgi:hypothetical protein
MRLRLPQFTIRDLLWLIVVVALVVAWYRDRYQLLNRQLAESIRAKHDWIVGADMEIKKLREDFEEMVERGDRRYPKDINPALGDNP